MGVENQAPSIGKGGQLLPKIIDRTRDLVEALQDAGYQHADIVDALLFEAGWMIEIVASGEADYLASKEELRQIVGNFSDKCAALVELEGAARWDWH